MLTPSFTCSQNFGAKRIIQITDTSTGSDTNITGRLVTITKADGTYLVPSGNASSQYILWSIGNTTIDIDVLDKDYSVYVRVTWVNGSTVSTYTVQTLFLFKAYTELFLYNLTCFQTSNKGLVNNKNFYGNKAKVRELIDSAAQAVEQANDIQSAQLCCNLAKEITDNNSNFY